MKFLKWLVSTDGMKYQDVPYMTRTAMITPAGVNTDIEMTDKDFSEIMNAVVNNTEHPDLNSPV